MQGWIIELTARHLETRTFCTRDMRCGVLTMERAPLSKVQSWKCRSLKCEPPLSYAIRKVAPSVLFMDEEMSGCDVAGES